MIKRKKLIVAFGISISGFASSVVFSPPAKAALLNSYQFNGKGNWSLSAIGSNSTPVGNLDALIPSQSSIVKAFLYSSNISGNNSVPTVNFDGQSYSGSAWTNLGSNGGLTAFRTEVTSQVSAKIGLGGGNYSFNVLSENPNSSIDGELLAIVYSNDLEKERTIAFLDGFSPSSGNTTTVNLAEPLPDPTTIGFESLLSLGIGYGFQPSGQYSSIDIDDRRLTSSAGGQDDGESYNGGLITVGGLGDSSTNPADPFANNTSGPRSDDELYDLAKGNNADPTPFLSKGGTSFRIFTRNPSQDDNIFFAGINITAKAGVDKPPEPVPEPLTILGSLSAIGIGGICERMTAANKAKKKSR